MPRQQPNWLRTSGGWSAKSKQIISHKFWCVCVRVCLFFFCVGATARLKIWRKKIIFHRSKKVHELHRYISEEGGRQSPSGFAFLTYRHGDAPSGNRSHAVC